MTKSAIELKREAKKAKLRKMKKMEDDELYLD